MAMLRLGQIISILAVSCGLTQTMTSPQRRMMFITIIGGMLSVIASILLVHKYGLTGVAVASSLAIAIQIILMLLAVKNEIGVWTCVTLSLLMLKKLYKGTN